MRLFRTAFRLICLFTIILPPALSFAQTFSRILPVDFYRDTDSRDLKGLATRSDGRLVAGPVLSDLEGPAFADLLWCLEPTPDPAKWLVGTGPDGKIFELTLDLDSAPKPQLKTATLFATLPDSPQVFALRRLPDGSVLAATSPNGRLVLLAPDGTLAALATLPADSLLDLLVVPSTATPAAGPRGPLAGLAALVATGNPGRVYEIDLPTFAASGTDDKKLADETALATRGIRQLAAIRDRNARRLALLDDGTLVIGSAPKGNLYTVARSGGAPVILQENRNAEVTALLPQSGGGFHAAIVFGSGQSANRITSSRPSRTDAPSGGARAATPRPPAPPPPENPDAPDGDNQPDEPPDSSRDRDADASRPRPSSESERDAAPASTGRFPGRSVIVWFPPDGFPETLVARGNLAFYAVARRGAVLVIAGGEQGDILAHDIPARLGLTYPGSSSAQINQIVPLARPGQTPAEAAADDATPRRFLLLRNNAPGLALLDFDTAGPREATTRRLDLGSPATLGALRLDHPRALAPSGIQVEFRASQAGDETEGWGPWTAAALRPDDDGYATDTPLRGRHFQIHLRAPASAAAAQIDRATLHYLPENRRPTLTDFQIAPPNFALLPPESASGGTPPSTLGRLLSGPERDRDTDRRRATPRGTPVFPQPGMRIITWTLSDPDGDNLRSTLSLCAEDSGDWQDLAVNITDTHAQFDTTRLADGVYRTRLVVTEDAPRPAADRHTVSYATDDLVIDHTPPEITDVRVARDAATLTISVAGRDALSLLLGVEYVFNNNQSAVITQPDDGILDGRIETFTLGIPLEKVLGATTVEVRLHDASGNSSTRTVPLR
ncbi:hypothetical protein OH491_22400 [Termitidicoccus mucosus]|uniref:Uncharacterized protein n=1 Tax=Termitidicoccus mucosus TaxID=1184151 RepID=A0A178IMX8_9BACT|nr:hypothetical protein AW736_04075 [Opitutaceae bacterium TSB47]